MNFMVLLQSENLRVVLIDFKTETDHHYMVASRSDSKAEWDKQYFQCIPYYDPKTLQDALNEYKNRLERETEE